MKGANLMLPPILVKESSIVLLVRLIYTFIFGIYLFILTETFGGVTHVNNK